MVRGPRGLDALHLSGQLQMGKPRSGNSVPAPTVNGRDRGFDQPGYSAGSPVTVDDIAGFLIHAREFATIANKTQALVCDNRFCDIRNFALQGGMARNAKIDNDQLRALKAERKVTNRALADMMGIKEDMVSKSLSGGRRWQPSELVWLLDWIKTEDAAPQETVTLPVHLPNEDTLREMFAGLLEVVSDEPDLDERARTLARLFPGAFQLAASATRSPDALRVKIREEAAHIPAADR